LLSRYYMSRVENLFCRYCSKLRSLCCCAREFFLYCLISNCLLQFMVNEVKSWSTVSPCNTSHSVGFTALANRPLIPRCVLCLRTFSLLSENKQNHDSRKNDIIWQRALPLLIDFQLLEATATYGCLCANNWKSMSKGRARCRTYVIFSSNHILLIFTQKWKRT